MTDFNIQTVSVLKDDTKRLLKQEVILDPSEKMVKTVQRAWLETKHSGQYTAILKDSEGNIVETLDIPLIVPISGNGAIEMRLQVYPLTPLSTESK